MEPQTKRKRTTYPSHVESFNTWSNHDDLLQSRFSSNLPPTSQKTLRARASTSNDTELYRSGSGLFEHTVDDELEQVVVAVDVRDSGTVGCSYYSALEEKLYLLGDLRYSTKEIIDSCLSDLPHSVLRRLTSLK